MDLALYGRVLWRFRLIVAAGFVVACVLALMTVARVQFDGRIPKHIPKLTLRHRASYESQATLLITQPGFPWGSAVQRYLAPADQPPAPIGDPTRLVVLTNVYIGLANSDEIRQLMLRKSQPRGTISVAPSYATLPPGYQGSNLPTQLPIMKLTATGDSRADAITTASAWIRAFQEYIRRQQQAGGIDPSQRIILQTLKTPSTASQVGGPKTTLAIVAFLAVMIAVIGLAFVLENLRPRPHLAAGARGDLLGGRSSA